MHWQAFCIVFNSIPCLGALRSNIKLSIICSWFWKVVRLFSHMPSITTTSSKFNLVKKDLNIENT